MTQDYQIMPSLEHCSSMVSLFGRSEAFKCNMNQVQICLPSSLILELYYFWLLAKWAENKALEAGNNAYSETIFNIMLQRDVLSWNSLIHGYVLHGYPDEAINLFSQLKKGGLKLNRGAFLNVLHPAVKLTLVNKGKQMFTSMVTEAIDFIEHICPGNLITQY
ncbi:hypothetical protein QQ045_032819 [Rhodiola kirilowii]